jgi:hypothetical protein
VNWTVEPEERARRDRVRAKLFTAMLTAYGYAMLGASLWEPVTRGENLEWPNYVLAFAGLVSHAVALYIAPRGEP